MNMTKEEDDELFPCHCCGSKVLTMQGGYEICDVCGWEDDPVQSADPDYPGGANKQSLNQAKIEWLSKFHKHGSFISTVGWAEERSPTFDYSAAIKEPHKKPSKKTTK